MPIFLPVAGISSEILLLVGAGALVGFLSGLLGVGGGFLLTPILMMLGIPATVAAASDTSAIVATSSSGVAAHFRLGNVDVKMGILLLLGGLGGAAIGVDIITILRGLGNADVLIELTYILVLGSVGGLMFADSIRNLRRGTVATKSVKAPKRHHMMSRLPFQMEFPRSGVQHSALVPLALGALVGILSAIMGVGGGFLMVPMMVYVLGMSAHLAVGTSLFQVLFTCAGVCFLQSGENHTVDVVLALMLAAGSTIAAQIGAIVSKRMRGDQLLMVLAVLALVVVGKMSYSLVVPSPSLLEASRVQPRADAAPKAAVPGVSGDLAQARPPTEGRAVKLIPETVEIGAFYDGTSMRMEGVAAPGTEVIVVTRGPDTAEEFKRKGPAGPIWMTLGKVRISGAPSLFIRYSSEPANKFLSHDEIDRYQLSPEAITRQMHIAPADPEEHRLRHDYLHLKLAQNVYRVIDGGLHMGATTSSGEPYSIQFHWPRKAPPAEYQVRVHECRDGRVVNTITVPLKVVKAGFPAAVSALATKEPWAYGMGAIVVAILAGFGIDFIAASLKRRFSGPRPPKMAKKPRLATAH